MSDSAPSRPLVLIIDDEHDFRVIVAHLLERGGFGTVLASDGAEGLRVFEERRPDIVVLDGNLPDIDGIEVCRRLRATAAGKTIPILMCTVRSPLGSVAAGLEAGATDYVLKPFEADELIARVKTALKGSAR